MLRTVPSCAIVSFLTLAAAHTAGQPPAAAAQTVLRQLVSDLPPRPPRRPVEFEQMYNQRFLDRDPKLGEVFSDVVAWDEDGAPVELAATRGKYTVLVFGCLT